MLLRDGYQSCENHSRGVDKTHASDSERIVIVVIISLACARKQSPALR